MKRCTVNSCDLDVARELSGRLNARSPAGPASQARERPSIYAQLTRRRTARPSSPAADAEAAASASTASSVPLDLESWEVFLAWGLELCRARAAFVVDSQGFVIASRGNTPADGFEGTGAELCFMMEQMSRVDPDAGELEAIELHFAGRKLLAVRGDAPDDGSYVLGFVGSRPLAEDVRRTIIRQLEYSLPTLS